MTLPLLGAGPGAVAAGNNLTLPAYLSTTTPTLFEGFETTGDWTASGPATLSGDTARVSQGTQSLKLTGSGSGTVTAVKTITGTVFSGVDTMAFDVYAADAGCVNKKVAIAFAQNSGLTRTMSSPQLTIDHIGWNHFQVKQSAFTGAGGGVWSDTMIRAAVQVVSITSGLHFSFDNWLQTITPSVGVLVWTLHDSWSTLYSAAYPEFTSRSLKATLVFDTARIATTNHVSWAQMREMIASGFEVANHQQNHTDPTTLTEAQIETEIAGAETDYANNSVSLPSTKVYVPPSGGFNDNVRTAAQAKGYSIGESINQVVGYLPYPEPLQIASKNNQSPSSVATIESWYDDLKANGGCMVQLVHDIASSDAGRGGFMTLANLQTVLDYTISIHLPIISFGQLYQLQTGNAVTVQVPWVP